MTGYVMVPVPADLVTDVMRYITDRAGTPPLISPAEPPSPPGSNDLASALGPHRAQRMIASDDVPEIQEWTEADLQQLFDDQTTTGRTVSAILTELARVAEKPIGTSELEATTGIARVNIRGSLSAFTRRIRKHYGGRSNWPMDVRWGHQIDPALPEEAYYSLDQQTASRWKAITGA
jgi:hypothetical protein